MAPFRQYFIRFASSTDADRVVHRRGPAGSEDGGQDRQPDDHLGGGHHHYEERDHLTVERAVHPGERHERQIGRVEHELDAHEHHDRIASHQHANSADDKQDH
jgi:hypothetical protein